jgi:hypothetical protein
MYLGPMLPSGIRKWKLICPHLNALEQLSVGVMALGIMTLSIIAFRVVTLSFATLSIKAFSITTTS